MDIVVIVTSLNHITWGLTETWILTPQDAQYLGHGCKLSPSTMQACFSRSSGHSLPPPIAMCFTFRLLLLNPGERLPERHVLEQGPQEDHSVVSQSFGMMQDWTVKGKESFMQRLKGHKQKPVSHRLNRCNQHYEVPIIKEKNWNVVYVFKFEDLNNVRGTMIKNGRMGI